jgi:hypothetical protein
MNMVPPADKGGPVVWDKQWRERTGSLKGEDDQREKGGIGIGIQPGATRLLDRWREVFFSTSLSLVLFPCLLLEGNIDRNSQMWGDIKVFH